ncbi:MAG: hypothetical protein PHG89_07810 [Gallionella sp.]|nr:hypothetical protein [Gallionella sp.]
MKNQILLMFAIAFMASLSGCAKKDLIVDMGNGDSIRLVGDAGSFDCDDPAYAKVDKVVTSIFQFHDGTTKRLCAAKKSGTAINSESPPSGAPQPTPPSVPVFAP